MVQYFVLRIANTEYMQASAFYRPGIWKRYANAPQVWASIHIPDLPSKEINNAQHILQGTCDMCRAKLSPHLLLFYGGGVSIWNWKQTSRLFITSILLQIKLVVTTDCYLSHQGDTILYLYGLSFHQDGYSSTWNVYQKGGGLCTHVIFFFLLLIYNYWSQGQSTQETWRLQWGNKYMF